ncbi:MAG TPA: STAS domain-containing protein [Pseudothermotoga sp.]|nr:STAS domain-containing protein [Pseudothermotoga sp.]HOK84051.1 STAS domain-containing protein [Pseudothermotoga sp.]HPP70518.1 STAS domain-containing protein [Pseudothermotoga sp.]
MNDVTVKFEQAKSKLICKIEGDFDAYHSADIKKMIKEQMEKSNNTKIVLDMSNVPYIDSAGLGTMVSLLKDARNLDKELILCSLRQNVKRIFEMTRLDKVFKIVDVVEEA